jgi:hypothetical protein
VSQFSVNQDIPVGFQEEEVEVEQHAVVEPTQEASEPKVHLDNIDAYKKIVSDMRNELIGLIREGVMTEAVAERLVNEFMHTAFTQLVKINLR